MKNLKWIRDLEQKMGNYYLKKEDNPYFQDMMEFLTPFISQLLVSQKEEIKQVIIEDVPHKFQDRLLKVIENKQYLTQFIIKMSKKELKIKLRKEFDEWDNLLKPRLWEDHLNNLLNRMIKSFREYSKDKCSLIYDELGEENAKEK